MMLVLSHTCFQSRCRFLVGEIFDQSEGRNYQSNRKGTPQVELVVLFMVELAQTNRSEVGGD